MERLNYLIQHTHLRTFWTYSLAVSLISIFILWYFSGILDEGLIVFGDIDFGFFIEGYIDRMSGTWNFQWSNPNFFNISRWMLIAPFYYCFLWLGLGAEFFLKWFIFIIYLTAGFGTFVMMKRLLLLSLAHDDRLKISSRVIFFIALFCAFFYTINPWSVVRLQHFYLLVGYATLPCVFYYVLGLTEYEIPKRTKKIHHSILRPWENFKDWFPPQSLRNVVMVAFFWALGSGAVHYLFFTFFLIALWTSYRAIIYLHKKEFSVIRVLFARHALVGGLLFGMTAYFLWPQILSSALVDIAPNNVNTYDTIHMLSRNSSWLSVNYLVSYWWNMMSTPIFNWPFLVSGGIILLVMWTGFLLSQRNYFAWFFMFWTLLFLIISLGTNGPLRDLFLWLVFDAPLSGQLGFLFRDPNKLISLVIFGYTVLLGTSLLYWIHWLQKLSHQKTQEIYIVRQVFKKYTRINFYKSFLWGLAVVIPLAYFTYIYPYKVNFVDRYYRSVEVPKYYLDTNQWLKHNSDPHKTVWLPRNEMIVSPGEEVAMATWNMGSATSSIDVFSTQSKTYNTTEGVTPYMGHWYEFLFNNIEKGLNKSAFSQMAALSIRNLIYHDDILGFKTRALVSIKNLLLQNNVLTFGKIGDNYFFQTGQPVDPIHVFRQAFISTQGFYILNLLGAIPEYNFRDYAHWFAYTEKNNPLALAQPGDIVNFKFMEEMVLKFVNQKHFISLYDQINRSEVLTRWGQNRVTSSDFKWNLNHLQIKNWTWDFNLGDGVVYTYAPEMVDIKPYENILELGNTVLSTEGLKSVENDFFTPEYPDVMQIDFAPQKTKEYTPFLKGVVSRGDVEYWKIATSDFINVESEMGYVFKLIVSGKNAEDLHGKVKYYNDDDEEIGVSYVTSPEQVDTFDFIKFQGSFVTPKETTKMKLQFWTIKKPEKKVYWWVHQLEIRSLENYMKPNAISFNKIINSTEDYRILARVMHNKQGGKLLFRVDGETFEVKTKTPDINQFVWEDMGTLKLQAGFVDLELENDEGFNVVSHMVLVPEAEYQAAIKQVEQTLEKTKTLYLIEPRSDGFSEGTLQHDFINQTFSNGRTVAHKDGIFSFRIDVGEAADYHLMLQSFFDKNFRPNLQVRVLAEDNSPLFSKDLSLPSGQHDWYDIDTFYLVPGTYFVKIIVRSDITNYWPIETLKPFVSDEDWFINDKIFLSSYQEKLVNKNCSTCESLGENYLAIEPIKSENAYRQTIDQGCSCWWVITATQLSKIDQERIYNLKYEYQTRFANVGHLKVVYLDENKVFLDYDHIDNFPEYTNLWQGNESVISPPEGAHYAQFQVWARKNPFGKSEIWLRNLQFYDYLDMVNIDSIALFEAEAGQKKTLNYFFSIIGELPPKISQYLANQLPLKFSLPARDKRLILQISESYTPLWELKAGTKKMTVVPQMGILTSFIVPAGEAVDLTLNFVSQEFFYAGVGLTLLTTLVALILYFHSLRRIIFSPNSRAQHWLKSLNAFINRE